MENGKRDPAEILKENREAAGIFRGWRRFFTVRFNDTTRRFFSDRSAELAELARDRATLADRISTNETKEQEARVAYCHAIREGENTETAAHKLAAIWDNARALNCRAAMLEKKARRTEAEPLADCALEELNAALLYARSEREALTSAKEAAAEVLRKDPGAADVLADIDEREIRAAEWIRETTAGEFAALPVSIYETAHGKITGGLSDPEKLARILKAITATPEEIRLRF